MAGRIAPRRRGRMFYLKDLDVALPRKTCNKDFHDVYSLNMAGYHTMRLENGVNESLKVSHIFSFGFGEGDRTLPGLLVSFFMR
jgi:hypothetical protein